MSIQTSDADLKAAQLPVMDIDASGNIINLAVFAQTVQIGTNATLTDAISVYTSVATKVYGTISGLKGGVSITNPSAWQDQTSATGITLYGGDSTQTSSGVDAHLTESTDFVSSGYLYSGLGNQIGGSALGLSGGGAYVTLLPSRTVVAINAFSNGGSWDNLGGSIGVILNSTQLSIDLAYSFFGGDSNGSCSATITGASLSNINFSIPSCSWSYFPIDPPAPNSGIGSPSFDFSGCILTDACIDAIVQTLIATGLIANGIYTSLSGTLNVGGTCATTSAGTQADIATLQGMGWNVIYNT